MDVDEENPVSVSLAEPSAAVTDDQTPVSTIDPTPLPAMQTYYTFISPPPIVPPIAPIPSVSAPILRPLAPLPAVPRQLQWPTNDMAVRTRLRRLGEPITLFGEREMERRDRLRMIMAKLDAEGQLEKLMKAHEEEEAAAPVAMEEVEEETLQYPFYTEGSKSLLEARVEIAKYSIKRAASRLYRARRKRDDPDEDLDAEMIGALSGVAKIWSMPQVNKVSSEDIEGHLDRLARIAFHPSGKYLGTASFDKTWRLWDVETGSGICFSPNGYHLATGAEDNTCRIWDLRKKKSLYVIPAHSNLVSQVKFEPQEGYFLVTASYDMTAKVWSARDFKPVKTLSGHEAKVTSLDITEDGHCIATVSHDRTIKLWSSAEIEKEKAMDID
ncbi:U4/U6 small nuclear ribonucleoprotein PRP4-like protein [Vitis vinifera]|uniref:U4/U6 small nuclear ribonucleoprotein PRP4-like protein n=1 Tax=Vitis vinifera TaxID=29760 RepID=A0A438I612_VITVI|nr:U4/U6 small nuclear ribonucleoprotein PRP4-like protein [Vitis vinifera]